jgi:hypothetical protein
MEQMHAVNVLMMMPDGRLPDVNDGGWQEVARLMNSAVKDYPQRADFEWAHTKGQAGQPPEATSHAFPYAGYYVMRTGWQPDAVWALLDGGHFGYGHQHEDKGNVLMHAYGRLLLTEGGNYAYDNSEMRRYVLSTRAHNTIRVDGHDQNRRLRYNRQAFDVAIPSDGAWRFTPHYDVAVSIYDEGYGPMGERTVRHERKVILLKLAPGVGKLGPFAIVVDRLTPATSVAHTYQAMWHLNTERAYARDVVVQSADPDQSNLAILSASQEGLTVAVVSGQETPEWQGWKAVKNHQQGEYAPTPTALVEWKVSGPARWVTMLYPTPAGEACPIKSVIASPDVADSSIRLALADASVLDLSETSFE